ncbi:ABC transporter ATP-binding protein [Paenibacillus septentrionalis]|uniref:ABC transporter ATP-binding protein n=1 Tax=Paenibacillus septentrionalis TaxID=429342 RepID=A0ABW1VAL9_9BACL
MANNVQLTEKQSGLELDNISKSIGQKQLVAPLTLSLSAGNIIALCGGNGAGKSSIIRMIAGLSEPSTGTIALHGKSIKEEPESYYAALGYMPDDYQFTGSFTAFESLKFWGELKQQPMSRVRELLELVGLSETGRKKVHQFSKGMRQRLLLAQALLSNPSLLLLDEPTNGLDPYWMKRFVSIIHEAANQGAIVLFSTHQLQVAEAAADHIVFLDQGEIKLSASYADIEQQYGEQGLQTAYEAIFWGEEGPMRRVR